MGFWSFGMSGTFLHHSITPSVHYPTPFHVVSLSTFPLMKSLFLSPTQ